jgi:hypothetical protein
MKYMPLICLCLTLFACLGCQSSNDSGSASLLFPDNLAGDAHQTYVSYLNAYKAGTDDMSSDAIPPVYWANRVKRLDPIKVYIHRVNIVIVQCESDGIEEGKYVYIPISSYLPRTGDDGFTFNENHEMGEGVYNFKRSM